MEKYVTKLLPCAHCGSTDVHLRRTECTNFDESKTLGWYIECYECGIQTEVYPEEIPVNEDTISNELACKDVLVDEAHLAIDNAVACATEVWNTRKYNKTIDEPVHESLEDMDNDDIVALIKRATDVLINKANNLMNDITEMIKDDSNG